MMSSRFDRATRPATVAVVGCGFSGTMVALNLVRQGPNSLRILLFERSDRLARGTAYGASSPSHLLNVPARLMSAWPEEPDHFLNWLRGRDLAFEPGSFAPRKLYGDYLEELLHDAATRHGQRLVPIRTEIIDLIEKPREKSPCSPEMRLGSKPTLLCLRWVTPGHRTRSPCRHRRSRLGPISTIPGMMIPW